MSSSQTAHASRRTPPKGRASAKSAQSDALLSKMTLRVFLITLAIGASLILVASIGAYFHPDPNRIIPPLALLSAALTAFFGGFTAGRLRAHAPVLHGLVNGLLLTALMLLLSLCFLSRSSHHTPLVSALLHAAVPLLSALGALLGGNRKEQKRMRKIVGSAHTRGTR